MPTGSNEGKRRKGHTHAGLREQFSRKGSGELRLGGPQACRPDPSQLETLLCPPESCPLEGPKKWHKDSHGWVSLTLRCLQALYREGKANHPFIHPTTLC